MPDARLVIEFLGQKRAISVPPQGGASDMTYAGTVSLLARAVVLDILKGVN